MDFAARFWRVAAATIPSFGWGGHSGSPPTPFDNVDGSRLAGPQGSHPLAALFGSRSCSSARSDGLDGAIEIKHPVRIGEGIEGHLRLTALRDINARSAMLRLVGAAISEQRAVARGARQPGPSHQQRAVGGGPRQAVRGAAVLWDAAARAARPPDRRSRPISRIPAPRLGPPSGHYGTALIGWAVEARWDISMGGDERLARLVKVEQNIDYLRSGAVRLADGALFDQYAGQATAPSPWRRFRPCSRLGDRCHGQLAERRRRARRQVGAAGRHRGAKRRGRRRALDDDNGSERVPRRRHGTRADPGRRAADVQLKRIGVNYRLRALVDRQFRSDLAVERSIAIM